MAREAIVRDEIARPSARLAEGFGDAPDGVLGDVLVERARRRAGGEDAPQRVGIEGAKALRAPQRRVEIGGRISLAQEQDLPRLMRPDPRRTRAHEAEEACGVLTHLLEGGAEHLEVDGALAPRRRVQAGWIELEPLAAWSQLVTRDAGEVGAIDEELVLRDADRQEVGDMIVGYRVGVSLPGDEAIDGADAIDHPRRIVGMARQGHEVLALFGEAVEGRLAMTATLIDDGVEPSSELVSQVVEVDEGATVEEGALDLPKSTLDTWLGVGLAAHAARPKLVVCGEGEEARIVDGLLPLPSQHDGLLAVIRAARGGALELVEGTDVAIHERVEVGLVIELHEFASGEGERVREGLYLLLVAVDEGDLIR
ncbi:hypothetical protein WMF28_23400 [Sorangium sp. So ce590]